MTNKGYYILNLIKDIVITLILISIFVCQENILWKIVILLFVICSMSVVIKNIFVIIDKPNIVKIFSNIYKMCFLIMWFTFLSYAVYTSVINKNYSFILFLVPFYLVGIYLIYKVFIRNK